MEEEPYLLAAQLAFGKYCDMVLCLEERHSGPCSAKVAGLESDQHQALVDLTHGKPSLMEVYQRYALFVAEDELVLGVFAHARAYIVAPVVGMKVGC